MSRAERSRVWVTGVGAVTAAGTGTAPLADALRRGRSAVRPSPSLEGVEAGWVEDVRRGAESRHLDRSAAMLLASAEEAWTGAGITSFDPDRCAFLEGSSLGPMADLLTAHESRRRRGNGVGRPLDLVRFMPGAGGTTFARLHGLYGPVLHLSAGSASGAWAIAAAADLVASGAADVAVAGGAECPLQEDIVASFVRAGVAAPPCLPFDRRRQGTVLGEGAGALVLESEAAARRRGAEPLAVLAGWGSAGETASRVGPAPDGRAVREAARRALEGRDPARSLGWIKAHGTGTTQGDASEYAGLAAWLGPGLGGIPVTSLKSTVGHCLGASGIVEAVAAVLALSTGIVPATIGTTEPDPAMPGLALATRPLAAEPGAALLLSESFGGRCTALLLETSDASRLAGGDILPST